MSSEGGDLSVCTMESEKNRNVQSEKQCFSQTSHLLSYPEEAEHTSIREVAAGANHSEFGQVCSANISEFSLSEGNLPYLSSSLDADIEMYSKKRGEMCCAQVDESKKEADMLGRACDDTHLYSEVCGDGGQSYLSEDSVLDYLSAHEQDFNDMDSSSEFSEQREAVGTKTLKQIDPVREVPGGGAAKEQSLLDVSEDSLPTSEYGVNVCSCAEATTPELLHLLHKCRDMVCDCQEEQTACHSAVCGSTLEGDSSKKGVCPNLLVCDSSENGKVKDIPLTDGSQPPQMAVGEVAEHSDLRVHSSSVRGDSPLQSPRKRVLAEAMKFYISAEDCGFCGCEDPGVCTCGTSRTDRTTEDAESQFPDSEILTGVDLSFGVEAAGQSSCLNSEHHENLKNVTSDSTIDQAIDAGSDFRVCFTTNRSISAQVCLSSKAVNTELTMMNKSQPAEWPCETCAGIACNTHWSRGAGSRKEIQSQPTDTLEEHSDGNTVTAGRSSQIKEQHELRSSYLKISTDRLAHPDKQAVKNSAPSYCQNILQRAIEAELQLLNAHYKMCYQHCLKIYKLALEENACFRRCNGNAELGSTLTLVLEELKQNYNSMRAKIKSGTPLNALPPLSVEMKLFPISSSYVPCELFREDLRCDSGSDARKADFKAPKQQERKISVNMASPQTVCLLTDGRRPSDSASTKTSAELHKDEDVEREVKRTETENECSFICAGGLSSSVSEDDSGSHFQKCQIANILICVDSANYRYVFLCSKETNQAQLSAKEMNQKKKGKTIGVELVNNSSENKSSVSQILKAKHWHETQPVDNSQGNNEDKALTSASSAVRAPDATSASEKAHLHPLTSSNVSSSTQVPLETKCPGLKAPTEASDTEENSQQKTPASFSTSSFDAFISANALNLSSFTKLMNKLQEIHPEASRDKIVAALLEVKKSNKGVLSGLSVNSIVERTSAVLKKSTPTCVREKECK